MRRAKNIQFGKHNEKCDEECFHVGFQATGKYPRSLGPEPVLTGMECHSEFVVGRGALAGVVRRRGLFDFPKRVRKIVPTE